jgi:hypothetical protein
MTAIVLLTLRGALTPGEQCYRRRDARSYSRLRGELSGVTLPGRLPGSRQQVDDLSRRGYDI